MNFGGFDPKIGVPWFAVGCPPRRRMIWSLHSVDKYDWSVARVQPDGQDVAMDVVAFRETTNDVELMYTFPNPNFQLNEEQINALVDWIRECVYRPGFEYGDVVEQPPPINHQFLGIFDVAHEQFQQQAGEQEEQPSIHSDELEDLNVPEDNARNDLDVPEDFDALESDDFDIPSVDDDEFDYSVT